MHVERRVNNSRHISPARSVAAGAAVHDDGVDEEAEEEGAAERALAFSIFQHQHQPYVFERIRDMDEEHSQDNQRKQKAQRTPRADRADDINNQHRGPEERLDGVENEKGLGAQVVPRVLDHGDDIEREADENKDEEDDDGTELEVSKEYLGIQHSLSTVVDNSE